MKNPAAQLHPLQQPPPPAVPRSAGHRGAPPRTVQHPHPELCCTACNTPHPPGTSTMQHQPLCLVQCPPTQGQCPRSTAQCWASLRPSSHPAIRPLCPAQQIPPHQGIACCLHTPSIGQVLGGQAGSGYSLQHPLLSTGDIPAPGRAVWGIAPSHPSRMSSKIAHTFPITHRCG